MTYETPCRRGNPDDWFIEVDGKQYPDDPELLDDELRESLTRRRHAREACLNDCYFRMTCLNAAVTERKTHGIWGGYYQNELRQIIEELDLRRRRRRKEKLLAEMAG